jgi:hypothetical protein
VELAPGQYDDPIRLSLRTEKLNEFVDEYGALYYAWGMDVSSRRALVDGYPIRVTESLNLGLRRLRYWHGPRTLWVDALCINQTDMLERSHQVQQMASIYKAANEVVIWLGEWPISATCLQADECQASFLKTIKWSRIMAEIPRHVYQHFADILALPWFSRLWVVQELALAMRDPVVLVGGLFTK